MKTYLEAPGPRGLVAAQPSGRLRQPPVRQAQPGAAAAGAAAAQAEQPSASAAQAAATASAAADTGVAAAPAAESSGPSTLDPQAIVGKLDNGLTYFVRPNHKPEKRALLRLVVNAGSILETDDQRGWRTSWSTWPSTARKASPRRRSWTSSNRSACASARRPTPSPATTRPSTCWRSPPRTPPSWRRACRSCRSGRAASASIPPRWTGNAGSSSRSGGSGGGPTPACSTARCRCCSRAPATPKGSRSERWT